MCRQFCLNKFRGLKRDLPWLKSYLSIYNNNNNNNNNNNSLPVPFVIGCLGGGINKSIKEVQRIFENDELAK